jgi:hypothetical protein
MSFRGEMKEDAVILTITIECVIFYQTVRFAPTLLWIFYIIIQ